MRGDAGISSSSDVAAVPLKFEAYCSSPNEEGGNNDHSNHSRCQTSDFRADPGNAGSSSGTVIRSMGGAARPDAGPGLPPVDGKLTVCPGVLPPDPRVCGHIERETHIVFF